jgi:Ca-activated chloride channel homolog
LAESDEPIRERSHLLVVLSSEDFICVMKSVNSNGKTIRPILILVAFSAVAIGLLFATRFSLAQTQDGRPRRSGQAPAATPAPTATPTPAKTQTNQTPQQPAQTPSPRDRRAPTLGDAPPPPKLKPKPTPVPTPEEIDPNEVIKINTDLVNLHVRVIDRSNRQVGNLTQNDFHVFEDGVAQPIFSVDREEVPITYGLAVDTSLSLRNQIQSVIDAAKTIVNSNKKGDETFVERFISSDKIDIEKEFTANKDELIDAVDNLFLEGGQTAVIDGVYLAAEHVAEYRKGDDSDRRRRALIVVTDGEDRHSFYTEPQLMQRLREEDVQIYVIGFVNELDKDAGFIKKSPRDKAMALLNKLASETGGHAFFPQSLSEIPEIAREIVRDMRTQYVVAYNPTNKERDGSYRAIRVAVDDGPQHDKRIALTRPGRLATPATAPNKGPATRGANPSRPAANGVVKSP